MPSIAVSIFWYEAQQDRAYQCSRVTADGFERGYLIRGKRVHGFATVVNAIVSNGKEKAGTHRGRVAVRKTGSFSIQTGNSVVQSTSWKHCRLMQPNDGYRYDTRFLPGVNPKVSAGQI